MYLYRALHNRFRMKVTKRNNSDCGVFKVVDKCFVNNFMKLFCIL